MNTGLVRETRKQRAGNGGHWAAGGQGSRQSQCLRTLFVTGDAADIFEGYNWCSRGSSGIPKK